MLLHFPALPTLYFFFFTLDEDEEEEEDSDRLRRLRFLHESWGTYRVLGLDSRSS